MHNEETQCPRGGTARPAISRKKKELALALCVSLWMAGEGVAGATDIDNNTTINTDNNGTDYVLTKDGGVSFTVADGGTIKSVSSEQSGNIITVTGGTVLFSKDTNTHNDWTSIAAGVSNNVVNISGGTISYSIYGGYYSANDEGGTSGNKVVVSGGTFEYGKTIYGGRSYGSGGATGNEVIVTGGTLEGVNIEGGRTSKGPTTGNTVTLGGVTVHNVLGGNNYSYTDNTLNLSGVNQVYNVNKFETVNIVSAKWGTPTLTIMGGNDTDINTLDKINTKDIVFTDVDALSAGQHTVLIKNKMTGYAGTILSGKYKVGTTLEGTGKASVSDDDLIYTIDAAGETAREQTHNTVMGAEVGMAALSMGNDFIGAATEGLALAANTGADGIASFAQMGGAAMRQETGSHVDVHTWNAILGLGHQNKKERGTMEYGAFFEYGRGNYTTHAENDLRGDGNAQYTGGGLLAKYTMKNDVYVEGSLRIGTVKDDARDVMSDGAGNPYSYKTSAGYQGFHIGVGKEIALSDGNSVDVYGKYFFNHKNGVSFNAGGHYDLDAVTSSVIRLGARYTVKRDKWNFYGGVAYEHELDGKATGTADGVAIRAADTSGASFRAEVGATMQPGENSPWKLDLNLAGFAGKKQGFTGGVSVGFMF